MATIVRFAKGLKPMKNLGFKRPAEDVEGAKLIEVRTGKTEEKKKFATLIFDQKGKVPFRMAGDVSELMALDHTCVETDADGVPSIDLNKNWTANVPADPNAEIRFFAGK